MSLKTWKEIYYPKPPSERMTKKAAIEHSLQKWIGLRKSNLKKHGVSKFSSRWIEDAKDDMCIDGDSCALCVKYLESEPDCQKCPLAIHLGRPCDGEGGVYGEWTRFNNPKPMIKALKALLEDK